MASFISGVMNVSFDVDADNFDEQREARVAVQEIPGGDDFYVDLAGRRPLNWRFRILLPNATAWGRLNAVLGAVGTLSVEAMDTHQAVLLSLSRPAPQADGRTLANAAFLITDA